jgi:ABC-type multidrug transport system ATPase subunit
MLFSVFQGYIIPTTPTDRVYLQPDNWDDWFEFSTQYSVVYIDKSGVKHDLGHVKIGQFAMEKGQRRPNLPEKFNALKPQFFSLGQDNSYYETLNGLGDDVRDQILTSLNDVAKDAQLFEKALMERVTKHSLLRFVTPTSVKGQFRRLAQGGASLSRYAFTYTGPSYGRSGVPPLSLSFTVEPESNPPTNIHVLIGRNGVGKTHLLNNMITSLIDPGAKPTKVGYFTSDQANGGTELFANLVSVTFSAFDESEPLPERKDKTAGIQYSYIGLKREKKGTEVNQPPKSPLMLKNEFVKSVWACRNSSKLTRWKKAMEMLEADPIFKEAEVTKIAELSEEELFKSEASSLFHKLSSGHKIVLLTITRLVESVEERTLILLDEPEAHLHPPLLSAFVRALSDLLVKRNGVAIIATHSPVVVQEVPRSCVWKLRRTGVVSTVERLESESFGENVGALTREVFGLEVTHAGFHKLLIAAVEQKDSYESVLTQFDQQLGLEARAIVRGLFATKNLQNT